MKNPHQRAIRCWQVAEVNREGSGEGSPTVCGGRRRPHGIFAAKIRTRVRGSDQGTGTEGWCFAMGFDYSKSYILVPGVNFSTKKPLNLQNALSVFKKLNNWCEQTQQLLRCWFGHVGLKFDRKGTSNPDENLHETPYYAPTKEAKEGRKLPRKSPEDMLQKWLKGLTDLLQNAKRNCHNGVFINGIENMVNQPMTPQSRSKHEISNHINHDSILIDVFEDCSGSLD
ncbi:hypothetical protein PanWU01x14_022030 [Parasponia andersonii]|uniref:Uncharacterized protein n=1 Tax=Parasponia andersonii TaxID=3476 RepID=A0A2P5DY45_PARAD|nr:hypothetical protein PanWU01x14_022030 [Parasponia andersonii]